MGENNTLITFGISSHAIAFPSCKPKRTWDSYWVFVYSTIFKYSISGVLCFIDVLFYLIIRSVMLQIFCIRSSSYEKGKTDWTHIEDLTRSANCGYKKTYWYLIGIGYGDTASWCSPPTGGPAARQREASAPGQARGAWWRPWSGALSRLSC